jgi:metallophosphoesterase superfamily enzyme
MLSERWFGLDRERSSPASASGTVESPLRPVPDAPALVVDPTGPTTPRTLIVSDVHLGLGSTPERPLGPPEASADRLVTELIGLARSTRSKSVLVAGDVKHPIVGTPPSLRPVVFDFFSEILREGLEAEVVLGNHDVGIVRYLPREVAVHPSTGVVRGDVGVFHGHRWPSNAVLRAPRLVAGHLHPGYRLAPTAGDPEGKRRCWVRVARPPPPKAKRRRRIHAEPRAREIVVLPAFNPIAGTESLNREEPARGRSFLYQRFLTLGVARAYLLDGTDLGVLTVRPTDDRPRQGGGRARPAR